MAAGTIFGPVPEPLRWRACTSFGSIVYESPWNHNWCHWEVDMGLGSPLTRSVPEAAELLGIGRNAAYEAVRRGQIPAIRVGRRWLVPVLALDQLLRAQTPQGPKAEVPKNLTRIRKRSRRQQ